MEHKLNAFKADLYNVFIEGNANNTQIARVFIILAIPALIMGALGLHTIKY